MKRVLSLGLAMAFLSALSTGAVAGTVWNGEGKINYMAMYPGYAVITQGNAGGVAGCNNESRVSFFWSDFTPEVQSRIQNMLLHAYSMKSTVELMVDDTACGPEGFKKFTGHIVYK